uniref:uncharacterized protein LOC143313156 n=1 Tax=Arvicanthis niloticus TaxID=61156 RepID=UPI00402B9900
MVNAVGFLYGYNSRVLTKPDMATSADGGRPKTTFPVKAWARLTHAVFGEPLRNRLTSPRAERLHLETSAAAVAAATAAIWEEHRGPGGIGGLLLTSQTVRRHLIARCGAAADRGDDWSLQVFLEYMWREMTKLNVEPCYSGYAGES